MSRKWKSKGNDVSVSFDSDKKVVYVGGEFIAVDKNTADSATVTNSQGESTVVNVALEFTGSKGDPNARISTLERNITILADALIEGSGSSVLAASPSANKWTSARTITLGGDLSGSVSIDGSSNVSLTATIADDSHNHVVGNIDGIAEYIQDVVGGMVTGNTESGITVTYDDAANEFDFTVTTAPKWSSARTITLGGDLSGSVSIDGSSNVTLTATVADDSHNHTVSNIDGLQTTINDLTTRIAALEAKLANVTQSGGNLRVAQPIVSTGDVTAFGA